MNEGGSPSQPGQGTRLVPCDLIAFGQPLNPLGRQLEVCQDQYLDLADRAAATELATT
jgi:hypothetical protein